MISFPDKDAKNQIPQVQINVMETAKPQSFQLPFNNQPIKFPQPQSQPFKQFIPQAQGQFPSNILKYPNPQFGQKPNTIINSQPQQFSQGPMQQGMFPQNVQPFFQPNIQNQQMNTQAPQITNQIKIDYPVQGNQTKRANTSYGYILVKSQYWEQIENFQLNENQKSEAEFISKFIMEKVKDQFFSIHLVNKKD